MCIIFKIIDEFYGFSKFCGHTFNFAAIRKYKSLRVLYELLTFSQIY